VKASECFKTEWLNYIHFENHPDGAVTVTIHKRGWEKPCKFKARNLNQEGEEILEDEEIKEEA